MVKKIKNTVRITLDVSKASHKKIKITASLIGMSIKDLITLSTEEYLKNNISQLLKKTKNKKQSEFDISKIQNMMEESLI